MTREQAAAASSCGLEAAVLLYVAVRIAQAIFVTEPNPAIAGAGPHAGYFWRAIIAGYGGGFVALLVALVVKTDRAIHLATRVLPLAFVAIVLQALLLP